MKPDRFGPRRTGRLVAVSAPGLTHAFLPNALPAPWPWPQDLWPLLLDAHKALSNLDGTARHLPDPELVLRPLQNREAQKSSSLEGTITDPHQQILFQLDPSLPTTPDDRANAHREVHNYALALRLRQSSAENLPLSLRLIRQLHEILMDGVRGADKNPGNFRRLQNQIGRPARYVPPPANELPPLLDNFEKYLHAKKTHDPLVEAFLVHYQFEAIHPFMDGNGRVGRLLLALTITEWCGLSNQWLYMSAYFDRNKDRYIDLLFRVSTEGAWRDWIQFCLEGVVEQSHDTVARCDRLIELNREFHRRVHEAGGSVRLSAIVDGLFTMPIVLVTWLTRRFEITYPTARSDLRKLANLGIVSEIEDARQITYYCEQVFSVIYADDTP